MKKLLLTLVTLVTATAASAQTVTVLWDGEDTKITSLNVYAGWWDRGNPTLVDNPEKDGINKSNKCLKFTMTGDGNKQVALPFRDWTKPDLKGNRRLSFMIKKEVNDNVLVELSDPTNGVANYWQKVAAWYGGDGKWQKVVLDFSTNDGLNDFPGVMAIEAQTGSVTSNQDVYIDNIVIEPVPMVGETALKDITDGSLTGNITLSGSYMKGECQNANGVWSKVEYNDFATLEAKLGDNAVTSVDMRGTILKDAYNSTRGKNPNCIVYADAFFTKNNENVVVKGTTTTLILDDAHPLAIPTEFAATSVELKRGLKNGINTLCLPFAVTPSEVKSTKIATFKGGVTFTTAESVAANTPFITVDAKEVSKEQGMTFSNKTIATVTNDIVGTTFQGIYVPKTSTAGMYGINSAGKIQEGAADIKCYAFRAWLTTITASARSIDIDGETTGISNVSLENPVKEIYNLNGVRVNKIGNKGIYIINGKKVIVK